MRGKTVGTLWVALASLALATGCTKTQLQGQSSSYLIIDSLLAGAQAGGVSIVESSPSSAGDDFANVTMTLALKDPGTTVPTTPTTTNFITVTRYHIDYLRSDGQNTQGVTVPFSFDGAITLTVGGGSAVQGSFTVVRAQAKTEAPLAALAKGNTAPLSTIARVTFYGADQAGRAVSVVGQIGVDFSGSGGAQ